MSVNAPLDGDYIAYFSADIGFTYVMAIAAAPALVQNTDAEGPLAPGRYLAAIRDVSDAGALVWLHVGPFVKSAILAPAAATGQGPARMPLNDNGFVEFTVVKGHNDRVAATVATGTATLHLTRVSRDV